MSFHGDGPTYGANAPTGTTIFRGLGNTAVDDVVFLHEAHHAGLNDSTAWGTALHILARLPEPARRNYADYLDACRVLHESYATYASVSLAETRHPDVEQLFDSYATYRPLYEAFVSLADWAGGPHRRYLLAETIATVCMQTTILDALVEADFDLPIHQVRRGWTPDGRLAILTRHAEALLNDACAMADAGLASELAHLDVDGNDLDVAVDERFDEAWDRWQAVVHASLARSFDRVGSPTLDVNGHQEPAARAVSAAMRLEPKLGLSVQRLDYVPTDDGERAGAVISQVSLKLVAEQYEARWADVSLGDLCDLVAETKAIQGEAALIVDVRRGDHLDRSYRWNHADRPTAEPIVSVRFIADDAETDSPVMWFRRLTNPGELEDLIALTSLSLSIGLVGASTLVDLDFQAKWFDAFSLLDRLVTHIDVEIERILPHWASQDAPIRATYVDVDDTTRPWRGIVVLGDDKDRLWLLIADNSFTNLAMNQIHASLSDVPTSTQELEAWSTVLRHTVTHILATETELSLSALQADR